MNFLNKNFILKILILSNLVLILFHLLSNHIFSIPSWTIRHWWNMNEEANIPTWFSNIQLFLLFILSIILSTKYSSELKRKHLKKIYIVMGFIFLFFSMDEIASIHEGITRLLKKVAIYSPFPEGHGMWIFIYPLPFLLVLIIFRKGIFLFLAEKTGRTIFIIGGLLFLTGGVLIEISGYYLKQIASSGSLVSVIRIIVEEGLELLGQSFMIYGLMAKIDSADFDLMNQLGSN